MPTPAGHASARRARFTAARAAALLALLGLAAGCRTTSEPSASGPPPSLTVATYNIRHGAGMDGVLDLERTAAAIAALDADIVALQEVDDATGRCGGVDQAAWLGSRLGMQHAFGSFMDFDGGRYGMAILSRFPIESATPWRLPTGHEPRVALAVEIVPPDLGPLTIIDVHFDWVEDDGFRFAQADAVAARLATLDTPWIVLGDFNDTPGSRTRALFAELGIEGAKPLEATATWPAHEPRVDIDSIVAGPGGSPTDESTPRPAWHPFDLTVVPEAVASDHRPVRATVTRTIPQPDPEVSP